MNGDSSTSNNELARRHDDLMTNAVNDDAMLEHLMHQDEGCSVYDTEDPDDQLTRRERTKRLLS